MNDAVESIMNSEAARQLAALLLFLAICFGIFKVLEWIKKNDDNNNNTFYPF